MGIFTLFLMLSFLIKKMLVVKKIDGYAEIDYRLTASPKFTDEYMDAYLKVNMVRCGHTNCSSTDFHFNVCSVKMFSIERLLSLWQDILLQRVQRIYSLVLFSQGEFKEVKDSKRKYLTVPSFSTDSDHKKMVYFWVTDYTLNTAGRVYHDSGKLRVKVNAWDDEVLFCETDRLKLIKNVNTEAIKYARYFLISISGIHLIFKLEYLGFSGNP